MNIVEWGDKMKGKNVSVVHLIYLGIIAIIILAFFLVFAFGDTDNAGKLVSAASTVSSLILSVIAIIMTIVDSAGQRNTISDLKETADKLEGNLISVNDGLEEINNLKEALLSSMGQIQESYDVLGEEITELKEKYSSPQNDGKSENVDYENVVRDLDELNKKISITRNYENINLGPYNYSHKHSLDSYREKTISKKILDLLEKNYFKNERYEINDFIFIIETLKISKSRLKQELNTLVNRGFIERKDKFYIIKE